MTNKPKRILIAEDDAAAAEALAYLLGKRGYEIIVVPTGEEAVERAAALKPDLCIIDLKLAGVIDGYETIRRIRALPQGGCPMVIMTNHGLPQEVQQGKAIGTADYIVKSDTSVDELIERLERVLNS
jgi:CheY-like chemotaxis protein